MEENQAPSCPDCKVEMERGHLQIAIMGGDAVSWCPGEPKRSWTGNMGDVRRMTVESYPGVSPFPRAREGLGTPPIPNIKNARRWTWK